MTPAPAIDAVGDHAIRLEPRRRLSRTSRGSLDGCEPTADAQRHILMECEKFF